MSEDTKTDTSASWLTYLLVGTGVAVVGGVALAAVAAPKVLPYALAFERPDLLPYWEAARKAKTPDERREVGLRVARMLGGHEDGATTIPLLAKPSVKSSPQARLERYYDKVRRKPGA